VLGFFITSDTHQLQKLILKLHHPMLQLDKGLPRIARLKLNCDEVIALNGSLKGPPCKADNAA
jgi:hypothetical protein